MVRDPSGPRSELLRLPALPERRYVAELLRQETVGGALLIAATVVALAWANSPWRESYLTLRDTRVGPAALHLDLTLGEWGGEGLLAIFFFVAGLELKRELVLGSLRRPAEAALPVVAALTGMAVPAAIYLAVTYGTSAARGVAIPTATDIAFCLAVLAVVGRRLPSALRAFLLTLAVVDDLVAIVIIAVFYSSDGQLLLLLASAAALATYGLLQRAHVDRWLLLLPTAVAAWGFMHASGVHPTVAGVAVGLLTRVRRAGPDALSPVERFEHFWRPVLAGAAVPLFALLSVGIVITADSVADAATDPAAAGVVAAGCSGRPSACSGAPTCGAADGGPAQLRPRLGGRVRRGRPQRHRVRGAAARQRRDVRRRLGP